MRVLAFHRSPTWYRFSRNPLSVTGAAIVIVVTLIAAFAPVITPFPEHAGAAIDFANQNKPPSMTHWFGTDGLGRDVFTRVIFGYRVSLGLGIVVLVLGVPFGATLGLLAGYYPRGRSFSWHCRRFGLTPGMLAAYCRGRIEPLIMRMTDVFLAIPALVFALAIMGFLEPNLFNAMLALAALWWPWHTRLAYNITRALSTEDYVTAAKVVGASDAHIIFVEILPNCLPSIMTKVTLDMGFVILIASALSFLGLGVQAPTPDLGTMVADGTQYVPELWWLPVFPGLAILIVVLGFNLLGDGLRDMLDVNL